MDDRPAIVRSAAAELYDAYVLKNYPRQPLTLVRGRGTKVWDDQGNAYLDFSSGIAVDSIGHCHPYWVEAVQRQAGEINHTSNLFRNPNQGELARRLVGYAGPGRVFFCNSGGEADEVMIKLSRLHGMRKSGVEGKCIKVICAKNGFHGRMFGGMSATPKESRPEGLPPAGAGLRLRGAEQRGQLRRLVDADTSSIFVETIQGDGGINPCTPEFLVGLRKLCDDNNLLLLMDEVQCGAGRTGKFFAFEHMGSGPTRSRWRRASPAASRSAPCGWARSRPTSSSPACTARPSAARRSRAPRPWPSWTSHRAGGPPGPRHAGERPLDPRARAAWRRVSQAGPRRPGPRLPGRAPDGRRRGPVMAALREHGLLTAPAGVNVIRLLPPLNASAEELGRSVAIFREVLSAL
jgi:acetylornithine/N-succinyldiaminopimelate aminotransferase